MIRVLLFTQNGTGRRIWRCAATSRAGTARRRELAGSGFYVWHWHEEAARAADRWWLIECNSAEVGRRLIEGAGADPETEVPLGRILASGGRGA